MFGMLKATRQFFWAIALLLCASFIGTASADGTYTVSCYQNQDSITVSGPEGVHVKPNMFPLFVNDTLTEKLSAGFACSGTNAGGSECTIDSTAYSYKDVIMAYSYDGIQPFIPGTGSASIGSVDANTGDAVLSASFPKTGYYKVTYTVRVDYTSTTCGNGSQDGYGNLSFAVQAGDFSFALIPSTLNIIAGTSASTDGKITSLNGFSQAVGFSSNNSKIGITASGSGTPPSNGTTDAAITVYVPNGAVPFSTSRLTW